VTGFMISAFVECVAIHCRHCHSSLIPSHQLRPEKSAVLLNLPRLKREPTLRHGISLPN
jgi:hypothetical protein